MPPWILDKELEENPELDLWVEREILYGEAYMKKHKTEMPKTPKGRRGSRSGTSRRSRKIK